MMTSHKTTEKRIKDSYPYIRKHMYSMLISRKDWRSDKKEEIKVIAAKAQGHLQRGPRQSF